MTFKLVLAVAAVAAIGYIAAHAHRILAASWFLVRIWRWLSGEAHHGKPITDAGWFRHGQRAMTPTGHARRWWHRPRWQRAAIRTGATLAAVAVLWGRLAYPQVTDWLVLAAAVAAAVLLGRRGWRRLTTREQQKTWLYPLHLAARDRVGIEGAKRAEDWITVELDAAGAVKRAQLALPQGYPADAKDKQWLVGTASAKLGIEAAEPSWRLAGPAPLLTLTQSAPPPGHVKAADLLPELASCKDGELILGVGKNGELVKVNMDTETPHAAISMGTGAGKSNLAGWLLLQMLLQGAVGLVLDAKLGMSHPWLLKDEHTNLVQLPNIGYARTTAQLHAAMSWLTRELDRRGNVSFAAVDSSGKIHANVGPRLIVLAEEMNLAVPRLRTYWSENREPSDPVVSPAFKGLGGTAFAGREPRMHAVLIGQMLTAEATGSRDSSVKEQCGLKCIARYGQKSWRIMVDDVPMPPPPEATGRIQVVTGHRVREVQAPQLDRNAARQLVLASDMAAVPYDMPCKSQVLVTAGAPALETPSDLGPETVSRPPVTGGPGDRVTLREAITQGHTHPNTTLGSLRMARHRDAEFPARAGLRGKDYVYDAAALTAWDLARYS
jgi:hypothetical protein